MKRLLALVVLLSSGGARATNEYVEQVLQPITTNSCVIVADVAYVRTGSSWETPGIELLATCCPNVISDGVSFKNRNAASLAGIRFTLEPGTSDAQTGEVYPGLSGDTLKVRVDLSATDVSPADSSLEATARVSEFEELVPLTLKCGLLNARRRLPRVRFVMYTIAGNPRFLSFTGTYPLEGMSAPAAPFQDDEPLVPRPK